MKKYYIIKNLATGNYLERYCGEVSEETIGNVTRMLFGEKIDAERELESFSKGLYAIETVYNVAIPTFLD